MLVSAVTALLISRAPADFARIYQSGTLVEEIDLSEVRQGDRFTVLLEGQREIRQGDGSSVLINEIAVEHGRIRMAEANCPDKTCVRRGWVNSGLMPIVCLPHEVVIQFEGNSNSSVDAVVG